MEYPLSKLPREVARLVKMTKTEFPDVKISVEAGGVKAGNWWIEFSLPDASQSATVEWRPGRGFGIYASDEAGYGEGPAETLREPLLAARRVGQKLRAQNFIGVKELRELYSLSQTDLAEKLGVQQAAISRFERRDKIKLETLSEIISCLGGSLEIRAHFPNSDLPIVVGIEQKPRRRKLVPA